LLFIFLPLLAVVELWWAWLEVELVATVAAAGGCTDAVNDSADAGAEEEAEPTD
jgi:hypothetical protein